MCFVNHLTTDEQKKAIEKVSKTKIAYKVFTIRGKHKISLFDSIPFKKDEVNYANNLFNSSESSFGFYCYAKRKDAEALMKRSNEYGRNNVSSSFYHKRFCVKPVLINEILNTGICRVADVRGEYSFPVLTTDSLIIL
jgi:hypothetical protein